MQCTAGPGRAGSAQCGGASRGAPLSFSCSTGICATTGACGIPPAAGLHAARSLGPPEASRFPGALADSDLYYITHWETPREQPASRSRRSPRRSRRAGYPPARPRTAAIRSTRANYTGFILLPAIAVATLYKTKPRLPKWRALATEREETVRDLRARLDAADARLDRLLLTNNRHREETGLPPRSWWRRWFR